MMALPEPETEMTPDAPVFQSVFGDAWERLPPVMRKHYAVRAGSADTVTVEGIMEIRRSPLARLLSPLLQFFGALHTGKDVPATVCFYSLPETQAFVFDRVFTLPGSGSYRFRSRLEPTKSGEVIEFMRFGHRLAFPLRVDGQCVRLHHRGYVWRVLGLLIPVPLALLLGKGSAWEEPLSDDTFRMWMGVTHPWFGETYSYAGIFRVTEMRYG